MLILVGGEEPDDEPKEGLQMLKFTSPMPWQPLPANVSSEDLVAELMVDGENAIATLDPHGRLVIETTPAYPGEAKRWGVALERTPYAVLHLRAVETLPALQNLGFTQI